MKYLSQLSPLTIAVAVSVLLHGALLTVRFVAPDAFVTKPSDPGLEVILVNAKHARAPLNADALAQSNLDGGGLADAGRSKSPLPDMKHTEMGESLTAAQQRRVVELEAQQQNLLTSSVKANFSASRITDKDNPDPARTGVDDLDANKAIARTAAEIHQRIEEQNKRPRKTFISPSTREVGYAVYYKEMQRRIEEVGTLNFPQKNGRKIYGALILSISIFQDGTLYEKDGGVKIDKSSGNPDLDKAAMAIVRRSGPFGRFPQKMRSTDKDDLWIVVTRFDFTREQKLQIELKESQ